MNQTWLKDVKTKPEQVAQRKSEIQAGKPALKVLKNILERQLEEAQRVATSKEMYDSPSWAYLQADAAGTIRTYREIISLLDLGDK